MTETNKKMGRPSKGVRRSVALTIPEGHWHYLDNLIEGTNKTMADYLRELVLADVALMRGYWKKRGGADDVPGKPVECER